MSLYLKYRPQTLVDVVGQAHVTRTLLSAFKNKALTHAYLFSGPRGTGKTSLARIMAKTINCQAPSAQGDPCNACSICISIAEGRLVDLIEIDAASNRGIDEIRELREKILFAPSQAAFKIYIIDEVHMLTKEAFNALLKTLEEPPDHAYFILATTEVHKIPETILSRCQQFSFHRISRGDILGRLQTIAEKEGITADLSSLELIAGAANGGLRDAIGLMEQMSIDKKITFENVQKQLGLSGRRLIDLFFKALMEKQIPAALDVIDKVNADGQNLQQFLGEWMAYLREQMLLGVSRNQSVEPILNLIEIFSQAKTELSQALIPQLPLEVAAIKACGSEVLYEEAQSKPMASSAPAPEAAPEEPSVGEFSLETIKSNWQRVLDRIDTPFIKTSFMDGEPIKLEKGNLHMVFKSSTLMEKVASPLNQKIILKAFEDVFGTKLSLKIEVKKVNLKPVTQGPDDPQAVSIMEMAKEVFGS